MKAEKTAVMAGKEATRSGDRPILVAGGLVVDPVNGRDGVSDVLIEGGRVARVAKDIKVDNAVNVDATDKVVTPGLIDMHVHLREPGREDEETIETGSLAAAAGGFATVVCMPNTDPPVDHASVVELIIDKARERGRVNIRVVGAISRGLQGEKLSEMADLVKSGAVAFSDDGFSIMNSELMRRAFEYSKMLEVPLISHAEDSDLTDQGQVNEGFHSTLVGLRGMPASAEEIIVARDLILAEATGGRVHFAHVSTAGSVALIRQAKERGTSVTCEVTPHHLFLTDELIKTFDPNYKVNPPLRTEEDQRALIEGLGDGTIDAIASDHAPHARSEKEREFDYAPFGMIGLETTVPLVLTKLVGEGLLDLQSFVRKLSVNPASVLRIAGGSLSVGSTADISIFDPKAKVKVDAAGFRSKSSNSPFDGWALEGAVTGLIVQGRIAFDAQS